MRLYRLGADHQPLRNRPIGTASGYLSYDPDTEAFTLTDEYAAVLADGESPTFLVGMAQVLTSTYRDEEPLDEAIRSGAGFGWNGPGGADLLHRLNADLYAVLARPGGRSGAGPS